MSKVPRFCIKCGSFCAVNSRLDVLSDKLWCKSCNNYTKTIDLLWDFEDNSMIIIAHYTKTDQKATYSLHENNSLSQKQTKFVRRWS